MAGDGEEARQGTDATPLSLPGSAIRLAGGLFDPEVPRLLRTSFRGRPGEKVRIDLDRGAAGAYNRLN
jgi:hypothetical protein